MDGLQVLERRADEVVVALDDAHLLQGLVDLQWNLEGLVESEVTTLVVDVSGVRRLSAPVVGALLRTRRHREVLGGQLRLRGLSPAGEAALYGTGLAAGCDSAEGLPRQGSARD